MKTNVKERKVEKEGRDWVGRKRKKEMKLDEGWKEGFSEDCWRKIEGGMMNIRWTRRKNGENIKKLGKKAKKRLNVLGKW